jgi:hypothetical protein
MAAERKFADTETLTLTLTPVMRDVFCRAQDD